MIIKNSKLQTPNSKNNWNLGFGHWKFRNLAEGQVMIFSIIFFAVVLILSSALFDKVTHFVGFGSRSTLQEQAVQSAEAGIDYAIRELNKTAGAYAGPETDKSVGATGTFSLTITTKTPSLTTITSTGYIPNATSPRAKRTIKADVLISSETISF